MLLYASDDCETKIGDTKLTTEYPIEVEIVHFRLVNRGSLKASFTLKILGVELVIRNCNYFVRNNEKWFSFPSQVVKNEDDTKTYYPYLSIYNKEYLKDLKAKIIEKLEIAQHDAETGNPSDLQDGAPALPF